MIRLTFYASEKPIWFNPEKIRYVFADIEGGTSIVTTDGCTTVEEPPEEVARKVLEWKLATEGYRIFTKRASIDGDYDVANSHYDELKRLAGLEEQA